MQNKNYQILTLQKIVILNDLKKEGFLVELYSNVVGNPTGNNVEEGVSSYKKNNCDGVVAFGGGSGLDVGKAIIGAIFSEFALVQLSPTSSKSHMGND